MSAQDVVDHINTMETAQEGFKASQEEMQTRQEEILRSVNAINSSQGSMAIPHSNTAVFTGNAPDIKIGEFLYTFGLMAKSVSSSTQEKLIQLRIDLVQMVWLSD